jgi:hypothetical protein
VYTHWIYSSQLDRKKPLDNGDLINDLMLLWTHGDFLGDVHFQNIVSDELVKWLLLHKQFLTIMPMKTFAFVDEFTGPECPLRQILIDWADLELTSEMNMKDLSETAPKWLMSGLLLSKIRREDGAWKDDPRRGPTKERYHVRQVAEA